VAARVEIQGLQDYAPEQFRALYPKCVSFFDTQFGELVGTLRSEGLWENSLVVVLADHGQGLGDHDYLYHVDHLYDSVLRVPLLVKWPGRRRGDVRPGPVSLLDVPRTVLAAAGIPAGRYPELRGYDLATVPRDRDLWEDRPLFAETYPPEARHRLSAVLFDGKKLIYDHDNGTYSLYDLRDDPGELNPLPGTEEGSELVELLLNWSEGTPLRADEKNRKKLSPEMLEKMRAHGYLKG